MEQNFVTIYRVSCGHMIDHALIYAKFHIFRLLTSY